MLQLFSLLTKSLGSPKDQKSEHMSLAVLFTTFLSFVLTMTVVVLVLRPAPQARPASNPLCLRPSEHLAERTPVLPEPTPTPIE
jgi:hypothetical protein